LGTGRYLTQFAAPLLLTQFLDRPGGRPGRWRARRSVLSALVLGPPAACWVSTRPALDPLRFAAGHLADDLAYGAGVWAGTVRARTAVPLLPVPAGGFPSLRALVTAATRRYHHVKEPL
jgi:hypothetical protein